MNQLVRPDTGDFIPYDSSGTSSSTSPGWYFTTTDDYATRSATATDFVRVEGPETLVKAQLQFLYTWNTLPTDFYYASLSSYVIRWITINSIFFRFSIANVYIPAHDWDAVSNGIYGQSHADGSDMDGVIGIGQADLSVGRAPVETAAEATTFVDKTLVYERLGKLSWRPANPNWPRKMLLASSDWGSRMWFRPTDPTDNATPDNGYYHHDATQSRSLLRSDTLPDPYTYEVIARVTENDRRLLPFKFDASSAVRGWYFAKSATDLTPSLVTFFFFGTIRVPIPTPWIVIHGSLEERTPQAYEIDPSGEEGSMADQEKLRQQVSSELPGIDLFDRYYEDEFDLPFSDRIAAPVDYLTQSKLTAGLNAAPHFVSLSGHGSPDGCCFLTRAVADGLTNGPPGFIGYADSCLTNQFDGADAMSEELIKNPNGGAVAYIGNTRFSWIGIGDDFQRAFFHRLTTTRHLGLLNDSRLMISGTTGSPVCENWAKFTLNLLGDPELQVYRSALPILIPWPVVIKLDNPVIRIVAERQPPVGPPIPGDPSPVKGVLVHIRQGAREFSGRTDAEGFVHLPRDMFEKGELEVTASHDDYAVATESFQVEA